MSLLMNLSLKDYCELLASSEPAPGGGSTAALAGVLGAALTMMVVSLSTDKKNYKALDEEIKSSFQKDAEKIGELKEELTSLVDEDTKAFNKFMEAMKLPKETQEQKEYREARMKGASLYAMEVPLKTAEKCFEILKNQKTIAIYGNKNAVSDIGVGALLALSGLKGAVLNVSINLPGVDDENLCREVDEKCRRLVTDGTALCDEIMDIVNVRIG